MRKKTQTVHEIVPAISLFEDPTVFEISDGWFKTQMMLLEEFKKIKESPKIAREEDIDERANEKEDYLSRLSTDGRKPSIEEMKEIMIKKRIEEMRPEHTWVDIARSLGISKKTLYMKRKKFDL